MRTVHAHFCTEERSNNFVIGLTDVSPLVAAPKLWNYTVCGQYPGPVGKGETVILQCTYNTWMKYLYNTCVTYNTLPAVYLMHAGTQIRHRPDSAQRLCKLL